MQFKLVQKVSGFASFVSPKSTVVWKSKWRDVSRRVTQPRNSEWQYWSIQFCCLESFFYGDLDDQIRCQTCTWSLLGNGPGSKVVVRVFVRTYLCFTIFFFHLLLLMTIVPYCCRVCVLFVQYQNVAAQIIELSSLCKCGVLFLMLLLVKLVFILSQYFIFNQFVYIFCCHLPARNYTISSQ